MCVTLLCVLLEYSLRACVCRERSLHYVCVETYIHVRVESSLHVREQREFITVMMMVFSTAGGFCSLGPARVPTGGSSEHCPQSDLDGPTHLAHPDLPPQVLPSLSRHLCPRWIHQWILHPRREYPLVVRASHTHCCIDYSRFKSFMHV